LGLAQTYSSTSWDSSCTVVYICSSAHLRQSIQRSSSPLSSSGYTVTTIKVEDGGSEYDPHTDALSDLEWDKVEEIVDFLQPAYKMTKRLKGDNCVSGFRSL
jgi:hypothetical protein